MLKKRWLKAATIAVTFRVKDANNAVAVVPKFAPKVNGYICLNVNTPAPANGTIVEVETEELCTKIVNNTPNTIALMVVVKIYLSKNCSTRLNTILRSSFTISASILNVSIILNRINRPLLSKLKASICLAPHLIAVLIGLSNTSSALIFPKSQFPSPLADFSRIPNVISIGNSIKTARTLKKS